MNMLPPDDIENILNHTRNLWDELRGRNIFITGGTGFFGKWLLGSFLAANHKFNLKAGVTVLSRNPWKFMRQFPGIASDTSIRFITGDVRSFRFPAGKYAYIIHAAVDADLQLIREQPELIFDTITEGTRRVVEFGRKHGAMKMLYTSSGAVYGRQPPGLPRLAEEYAGAPVLTDCYAIYGEAMCAAEMICLSHCGKMQVKTARCFSFVGPYLPLDKHFAIGNFIRDALAGKAIRIEGDGTPRRSYLYAADLAVWLWTILLRGKNGRAYNVGSEKAFSLAQAAEIVAQCSGKQLPVSIARKAVKTKLPNHYIPSTKRARNELGLKETVNLRTAIKKTIDFYR
jgi:dTDP-glucose 4,6-dehydratase